MFDPREEFIASSFPSGIRIGKMNSSLPPFYSDPSNVERWAPQ